MKRKKRQQAASQWHKKRKKQHAPTQRPSSAGQKKPFKPWLAEDFCIDNIVPNDPQFFGYQRLAFALICESIDLLTNKRRRANAAKKEAAKCFIQNEFFELCCEATAIDYVRIRALVQAKNVL
jgi:hypothetical protein